MKPSVALDPGARKFQTLYSEGSVKKIHFKRELLDKLHKKLNLFNYLRSQKPKHSTKRHIDRRVRKINNQIGYLRDD